jgi:ATP-dependent Lon protease
MNKRKSLISAIEATDLRWDCAHQTLAFESTAEVDPIAGVIGQSLALEALSFGLDCEAPGQNVFVRGLTGTGRMSMVQRLLSEMGRVCKEKLDRCYVHNFVQPDRPRLISLHQGQARKLRRRLRGLAEFIDSELAEAMNSKPLQASRSALQEETQEKVRAITQPFEEELEGEGLALVQVKTSHGNQAAIFPRKDGQPIPPEEFETLVQQGKISAEESKAYHEKREAYTRRLAEMSREIGRLLRDNGQQLDDFNEQQIRRLVGDICDRIKKDFDNESLNKWLDEVLDDVIEFTLSGAREGYDPIVRYGINVLLEHLTDCSPIVVENNPSLTNLLGTIESQFESGGQASSDYRGIRGGSLLQADNGFLVLDARDVLTEPGAWKILMRTLRTGHLEIVPPELSAPFAPVSLKPEPIPIKLRVVLLGGSGLYYQLDQLDNDFSDQFKVLADFDDVIEQGEDALLQYAGVLSRIAREEGLRHFTPCAVGALAEHGSRVAGKGGKLTTRFGRIADIAREANWVAGKADQELVRSDHVTEAVRRTKQRASLPSIRFQSYLKDGTIRIDTQGEVVGQINGLAVMSAGPLSYGFPARITATISAGHAGVIDIESRSSMSGSIHTKGFQILGGLLRHLLKPDHPLAFSASIAFEQSYGGIDGDSASGAEITCLLSALTETPIRQDLAMTGAIDQHGQIQAIGGVNEKVEGFFDICDHFGLSGSQGVLIPHSNAADLMLRPDVVEACAAGRFHVYAIKNIWQALELFTGLESGEWGEGGYGEGTLLNLARAQARDYWEETVRGPRSKSPAKEENEEGENNHEEQ